MLGTSRVEPLLRAIRLGMRGAGLQVESAKGECNLGQHEIAFKYDEAMKTCDNHVVYKTGAKEIAAQLGMALTFMAKYNQREGNSCHIHLSLRDEKGSRCSPAAGPGECRRRSRSSWPASWPPCVSSPCCWPRTSTPTSGSSPGSFAPTAVKWGHDNRTCALRVVGQGAGLRFENRVPGGDVNPYLAVAALIAAGLHGIDADLAAGEALHRQRLHLRRGDRAGVAAGGGRPAGAPARWPPTRSARTSSPTTPTTPGSSWPRSTRPSPTGSWSAVSSACERTRGSDEHVLTS